MPVPPEYERASTKFYDYLLDARNQADLWSTHVSYTMSQGVLQTFRARLTIQQAIDFANLLPICLRALFVTNWNTSQPIRPFVALAAMTEEVQSLRKDHNFAPEHAIRSVAIAIRKQVDEEKFDAFLTTLPEGAIEFWTTK
jgi:uncharacterized protein (DUF2267 family)